MTDLIALLKLPEGKTLEFERELSSTDGALRTIVAFANTAGGVLPSDVEDYWWIADGAEDNQRSPSVREPRRKQ